MRNTITDGWPFTFVVIVIGGLVFAGLETLVHGFSSAVLMLFACGGLIGAVVVPDLKPEAFRFPKTWQIAHGTTGFVLGATYFHASPSELLLAAILGAVFAVLVPYWFKHG